MKPKMMNNSTPASNRTSSSPGLGLRINQSILNETPKKDRRPSIEDMPSVKSKIQNYISATSEDTAVRPSGDEVREVQPQMTLKPILRKTSIQEPIQLTPILKRREITKERSKSPKKKAPKPVSDQFLSNSTSKSSEIAIAPVEMRCKEKNRFFFTHAHVPRKWILLGYMTVRRPLSALLLRQHSSRTNV